MLTATAAAAALGLSRRKVYALAAAGASILTAARRAWKAHAG
jgi:hypothetical protein